ncbi:hypothetical protein [Bacillus phage SBSphiJ6]|nr:hypothetical protein [Bacillus phage SBSphiJ6]
MSKFKNVEVLIATLDDWVERRVKSIEAQLNEVDEKYISVVNAEPEVKELAAATAEIGSFLKEVMDVNTDDPNHPLEYAKNTIDLMFSEIQECKDLPVEEDRALTPQKETPLPREATQLELAFVKEVNKLQEEVDVLVAYKAGTPALKKAQDKAVLLKRLSPALEEDTPSEIPPIYDILPSTCTKIENAIKEQSTSYGSLR